MGDTQPWPQGRCWEGVELSGGGRCRGARSGGGHLSWPHTSRSLPPLLDSSKGWIITVPPQEGPAYMDQPIKHLCLLEKSISDEPHTSTGFDEQEWGLGFHLCARPRLL